jgi:hypothetical protein
VVTVGARAGAAPDGAPEEGAGAVAGDIGEVGGGARTTGAVVGGVNVDVCGRLTVLPDWDIRAMATIMATTMMPRTASSQPWSALTIPTSSTVC